MSQPVDTTNLCVWALRDGEQVILNVTEATYQEILTYAHDSIRVTLEGEGSGKDIRSRIGMQGTLYHAMHLWRYLSPGFRTPKAPEVVPEGEIHLDELIIRLDRTIASAISVHAAAPDTEESENRFFTEMGKAICLWCVIEQYLCSLISVYGQPLVSGSYVPCKSEAKEDLLVRVVRDGRESMIKVKEATHQEALAYAHESIRSVLDGAPNDIRGRITVQQTLWRAFTLYGYGNQSFGLPETSNLIPFGVETSLEEAISVLDQTIEQAIADHASAPDTNESEDRFFIEIGKAAMHWGMIENGLCSLIGGGSFDHEP